MDELQYYQTRNPTIKHKKRLTEDQVRVLETNFSFNNKLDSDTKSQLALKLGVPTRQVTIWYQNRRAREKTQGLEVDHNSLRLQLEEVLEENARLKEETEQLKAELTRIQNGLNSFNSTSYCNSHLITKQNLERGFYNRLVGGEGYLAAQDGYNFFGSSVS